MTQAQLDLQTQLEQTSSDLTTHPLFNDSPVLFFETLDQTQTNTNLPNTTEQAEHEHNTPKVPTPPDNTTETPPPPKKRYEIMKDTLFLSSPVFPPTIPSKPSLSTNRDDHLIPLLSHDKFIFKAQLTSLYMHPTNYTFRLYDKNQDFLTSIASKIMSPYHYWLENGVKSSLSNSIFYVLQYMISRQTKMILPFSQLLKKFLNIRPTPNFYNTPNHKTIFLSITNILHRIQ